jgi:hypothetical protein
VGVHLEDPRRRLGSETVREKLDKLVTGAIRDRPEADTLVVSLVKLSPPAV